MTNLQGRTIRVGIALLTLSLMATAIGVTRSNATQSQGLAGGMSALKGDATSPSGASSDVAKIVVELAQNVGGDPSTALASLRLLRGNLGSAREALYVFSTGKHPLCVVFWPRGASCQTGSLTALPGVLLQLSPGGVGYPGQPDDLHAALAGVATDDVVSIALTMEGSSRSASVTNNAFFLDLGLLADWPSSTIEITATYADGSERSVALPNLAS